MLNATTIINPNECRMCPMLCPDAPRRTVTPIQVVCPACDKLLCGLQGDDWRNQPWAVEWLEHNAIELRAEAQHAQRKVNDTTVNLEGDTVPTSDLHPGAKASDYDYHEQRRKVSGKPSHAGSEDWKRIEQTIRRFYREHGYIGNLRHFAVSSEIDGNPCHSFTSEGMRYSAILHGLKNFAVDLYLVYRKEQTRNKFLQTAIPVFDAGITAKRTVPVSQLARTAGIDVVIAIELLKEYRPEQYALHYKRNKRTPRYV